MTFSFLRNTEATLYHISRYARIIIAIINKLLNCVKISNRLIWKQEYISEDICLIFNKAFRWNKPVIEFNIIRKSEFIISMEPDVSYFMS
ncbi:hypothetical protein MBUL_02250 [Methylobacterium bullatum]|uniref:Uncharacterized protein n=1 Tax=Methylobacterium bullatum TaxID=570505 RepID=A0A679JCA0_9HYPH|nr:hypothetical protein MBUL_02250 [Methylobacterium bullatum]